jgi:uncharacterized membrane protein YuzA (DUF378 family)
MTDLDTALSQISSIRAQLAASTRFMGIAPSSNALSGAMAFLFACWQATQYDALSPLMYVQMWAWFLLCIGVFATVRTSLRARKIHGEMALGMLGSALQKVLPFAAAGIVSSLVICRFASEAIWILPGLWQMLIGVLGFTLITTLPKGIIWASAWYFLSGALVMGLAAKGEFFSPWMMGLPFAFGQALVAVVLNRADTNRMTKGVSGGD